MPKEPIVHPMCGFALGSQIITAQLVICNNCVCAVTEGTSLPLAMSEWSVQKGQRPQEHTLDERLHFAREKPGLSRDWKELSGSEAKQLDHHWKRKMFTQTD